MARSAEEDPIEKFRFRITVIAIDLSITGAVDTAGGLSGGGTTAKSLSVLSRAGFSIATLPKATVKSIPYRENIDNQRFIQVPGLVTYTPITLSRGVTSNRNLYDWYRLVNEELALLAVAGELSRDTQYSPTQEDNFRKDVILEVLDREGTPIKAWYMFNAWPSSYAPGDSLDASSETKLIEEITLTYEMFLELEGGAEGFAKEIIKGGLILAVGAALDKFGFAGLPGKGKKC
jgi:phage tail-like protein